MAHLRDLENRANVNVFEFKGKQIFVYSDHRTILNILFFALKNNLIDEIPNVVYFDYHKDDLAPSQSVLTDATAFDLNNMSEREFNSIVEYDMSVQDDDWVKTGMEFNLINNAINIGSSKRPSYQEYRDCRNTEHHLINLSHLSTSLDRQGGLGDRSLTYDYGVIARRVLDYNNNENKFWGESTESFVLDFDLDCYSSTLNGKRMAWPEKMFYEEYNNRIGDHSSILPLDFINHLISECEFITICLESNFCGGFGESFKILRYLDNYFFEGTLKTNSWY